MRNNENLLSQSPSEELVNLRKKVESQQQKSTSNDQRIMQLKTKLQATRQRITEKQQKLLQVQKKVVEQKQKGSTIIDSLSEQSSQQSSSLPSSFMNSNSEIVSQLRQHFKALRMEMMGELMGQDQDEYEDEVDVDNMTYEELLELGDKIGKVSKGLDTKKMQSLEVKNYHNSNSSEPLDCAICRQQLEERTSCIELNCHHTFHQQCIKGWLNVEKHCPNCKREINI